MYDVVIIGAGVSGSAIARELSRYQVNACVVEKAEDVCCGTSKANSAIVHAGFDAENGSLMADLNVKGNVMMEDLSKELDFSFRKNGSLVICLHEEDRPNLEALYERGIKNGVKELKILEYMIGNQGKIMTRDQLAIKIWGFDNEAEYNNVEVYMTFTRKKLHFVGTKVEIKAIRGLGYELRAEHV